MAVYRLTYHERTATACAYGSLGMSKEDIIAYADTVILEKATWDTPFGMYALFALNQPLVAKDTANPFKRFTKRKGGKTGTRFGAVFTWSDADPCYQDEVMLKGWADGVGGWKLALYLQADDDGMHPFMGFDKGQEFALAMVELAEDNTVIDQVKRDKVEKGPRKQNLSNFAAMLCRTPEFYVWLKQERNFTFPAGDEAKPEDCVRNWMCTVCEISSRAELDRSPPAIKAFHSKIREPYAVWRHNQPQ